MKLDYTKKYMFYYRKKLHVTAIYPTNLKGYPDTIYVAVDLDTDKFIRNKEGQAIINIKAWELQEATPLMEELA